MSSGAPRALTPAVSGTPVRNEKADRHHTPAPLWIEQLLEDHHKCKVYTDKPARNHIGVWERLVRRLPITPQAKAVASVLCEHWPTIEPSINRIRDLSGFSRGTVNNAIFLLEHSGLLALESKRGRRTRYVPLYPERAITEEEVADAMKTRRARPEFPQPGHTVATSDDDSGTAPGHAVATHPATPCPGGGHAMADTRPPGGREVINQAVNKDMNGSPGADAPKKSWVQLASEGNFEEIRRQKEQAEQEAVG